LDIDWLKALVALMNQNDLAELHYEEDGRKVKLRKRGEPALRGAPIALPALAPIPIAQAAGGGVGGSAGGRGGRLAEAAGAGAAAGGGGADGAAGGRVLAPDMVEVKSPMVGTFYRAASPQAEAYVEVGTAVKEDSTLCLIEAMKVMNEIKAEVEGVVQEILIANGEAVEFGQPLFLLKRTR
jgi:acetyl-CoA carboxylase biotin carboxyl carrier protein